MEIASLIVFASALFVAAVAPGPGIAAIVARVLGGGASGAVAFCIGVGMGDLVWLGFAVGGLAVLAQSFHGLFLAVKWAGTLYLLYLAWKMWRAPAAVGTRLPTSQSNLSMLLAGLSLTMGNPKVMVFYLALLPSLVDLAELTWLGFAELALVIVAVLTVVFSGYVLLAARARGLLVSPGRMRAANRGAALAMAGAAGWVAAR